MTSHNRLGLWFMLWGIYGKVSFDGNMIMEPLTYILMFIGSYLLIFKTND